MYSVSFIFKPGKYDEEFYVLDSAILEFAHTITGFIGKENWYSDDTLIQNSVYYWETKEAVSLFSKYDKHLQAKKQYRKWYDGFQIVVSKVEASYGDGRIPHITNTVNEH